jgi:hypothetical protein
MMKTMRWKRRVTQTRAPVPWLLSSLSNDMSSLRDVRLTKRHE